jgi:4-amino-4-deoxychorismate lyase
VSAQTATWLDGAPTSALPLPDRGLDFGDGLFETLLLCRGNPLYPDSHLQRLQCGLQALGFPDCLATAGQQLSAAADAVRDKGWPWAALRLTVSRGAGPRGYAPPLSSRPRIIITATELDHDCARMGVPASVSLATIRWPLQPALAGIKHLNRLEQVLASAERLNRGTDEAVMLDQQGQLVSVVAGNLFLVRGKRLLTPVLDACGIAGTRRQLVMKHWGPRLGLEAEATTLTLENLASADEVFFSNSLLGVRPVASFGEHRWHSHPVCQALFELYRGDLL